MSRSFHRLLACVLVLVFVTTSFAAAAIAQQRPRVAPDKQVVVPGQRPKAGQPIPAKPKPATRGDNRANAEAPAEDGASGAKEVPGSLGNSKWAAIVFWLFAFLTIGGAIFVITRSNLVVAVMGMVGTFFAIAGLYVMLYAHFMAAIQVLVYAGAIMVLFVFVIMILNRAEDEPWVPHGLLGKGLASVAMLYLLVRLGKVLWAVKDTPAATIAAPGATVSGLDFGSTKAVGVALFRDYLFPFEAVSIVLLIAVVGAVAVARPQQGAQDHTKALSEEGAES